MPTKVSATRADARQEGVDADVAPDAAPIDPNPTEAPGASPAPTLGEAPSAIVGDKADPTSGGGTASAAGGETEIASLPFLPPVVGIGASAGGIEALSRLLRNLPEHAGFCYVVAQHLSADHPSMLTDILGRESRLPVLELAHGCPPAPDTVFITPAAANVLLEDGLFLLKETTVRGTPKPSVDLLFRSLALELGETAIGVVLSGTGADGSEGARALKQAGGHVFVQTVESARYAGMPQAAADTGIADAILAPEEIAAALERLSLNLPAALGIQPPELARTSDFERILRLVRTRTGIDLRRYKDATLLRRLQRRIAETRAGSLSEYLALLEQQPDEVEALTNSLHIVVTSFFRDTEAFAELRPQLAALIERKPLDEALRVWIAGCATGEEAYSIGILILEILRDLDKPLKVQIYATDLDLDALATARRGLYSSSAIELLNPSLLQRHFVKFRDRYQVSQALRELIVFARHDLAKDPPFLHLDLVSCRNLLIYFKTDIQARILETIHYALRNQGFLFLGRSETPYVKEHLFETLSKSGKLYRRRHGETSYLPPMPQTAGRPGVPVPVRGQGAPQFLERMLEALEQRYIPPGLLLDENLEIRRVLGRAGEYLHHQGGQTSLNAVDLIPRELGIDLRALIAKARRSGTSATGRTVNLKLGDRTERVRLSVHPLAAGDANLLFLAMFEPRDRPPEIPSSAVAEDSEVTDTDHLRALEQELTATREHLQTVVEELETTNEELQSTNEELQSANEELQSSNEELETTNEELQSTNEELATVNQELQGRTEQLALVNMDLSNVKDSLPDPLLVVDANLCIKLLNPAAHRCFGTRDEDIGKTLVSIRTLLAIPGLIEDVDEVIRSGLPGSRQIETPGNYLLRIQPYLGSQQRTEGAILTFWDNHDIVQTQLDLRQSEDRLRQIMDRSPLWNYLKDRSGRYLLVNRRMQSALGLGADQLIGRLDEEALTEEIARTFARADREALIGGQPQEVEHRLNVAGREIVLLASHFPLQDDKGIAYAVCMKGLDITARRSAEALIQLQSQALDASLNGIVITEAQGDRPIVYVNRAFSRITGYEPEEVRGRNCRFLNEGLRDQPGIADIRSALAAGSPVDTLLRNRRKDGGEFWNRLYIYPIRDAAGRLTHFVGVQNDVTSETEARAQLAASERRLRHAQTYGQVWSFEWDMARDRFDSLDMADDLFGAEYAGRACALADFLRLLHPADRPRMREAILACRDGGAWSLDIEYRLHDEALGDRWLQTRAAVDTETAETPRLLGLTQDITARKLGELRLAAARDEAQRANHAKNEFLSRMSHELRTPLNAILGFAQLLEAEDQEGPGSDERLESIREILRAGWHLLALINDILDLSRVEAGHLEIQTEAVDTRAVILECIAALTPMTRGREIEIVQDLAPALFALADRTRLKQVLLNIVSNAIKYNRAGGSVVIRSAPGPRGKVGIVIADSGIGMNPEQLQRLFQPFERLGRELSEVDGVGIGLSLSRQLMELMQGQVQVESSPGKGSVFTLTLPDAESEVPADRLAAASVADAAAPPRPRVRPEANPLEIREEDRVSLLYIEDNPANLNFMRRLLEANPKLRLHEATSGRMGIELAIVHRPRLILLDLQLPDMDGFAVLRRLRAEAATAAIPVVAVSADASENSIAMARDSGFDRYVTKPFRLAALEEVIAELTADRELDHDGGPVDR